MKFLLFLAALGSILGGIVLVVGGLLSKGAIQESAAAAYACALAVIPYVLARTNQLWRQADEGETRHRELLEALRRNSGPDGRTASPTLTSDPSPPSARGPVTVGLAKGRCTACGEENSIAALRCGKCNTVFDERRKLDPSPTGT